MLRRSALKLPSARLRQERAGAPGEVDGRGVRPRLRHRWGIVLHRSARLLGRPDWTHRSRHAVKRSMYAAVVDRWARMLCGDPGTRWIWADGITACKRSACSGENAG